MGGKTLAFCPAVFCQRSASVLPAHASKQRGRTAYPTVWAQTLGRRAPGLRTHSHSTLTFSPKLLKILLLMGYWDGFDMQAELHPGFVHDACVAEVPGRPLGPVQDLNGEALATF